MGLDAFPLDTSEHALVLLEAEGKRYALEVDQLVAQMDLVIRPLDERLGKVAYFSSISIDREGRPILIMDVDDLIGSFDRSAGKGSMGVAPLVEEQETGVARILVVDDSLTVREVERKLLEGAGYVVETAVDGMDGWNQILSGGFSLIISDVDMPRMNGIELVTKIKADARYHSLPIIIVSYKDREEDRLLGLNAGADFYLTKGSFQDQGLLEAIRSLVGPGAEA
jgi:two-component system sensor histidine kinase and response regulator WspE